MLVLLKRGNRKCEVPSCDMKVTVKASRCDRYIGIIIKTVSTQANSFTELYFNSLFMPSSYSTVKQISKNWLLWQNHETVRLTTPENFAHPNIFFLQHNCSLHHTLTRCFNACYLVTGQVQEDKSNRSLNQNANQRIHTACVTDSSTRWNRRAWGSKHIWSRGKQISLIIRLRRAPLWCT